MGATAIFPAGTLYPLYKEYSELSLSGDKVKVEHLLNDERISRWIISPILSMDKPVDGCRKEEFIAQVTQSPEFDRLTGYVLEHRADPTPCTKEVIIKAYKRLLSDYYDVMHEDEALKEEGEEE